MERPSLQFTTKHKNILIRENLSGTSLHLPDSKISFIIYRRHTNGHFLQHI